MKILFRLWMSILLIGGLTGCATKWLPDAESALNPPVAYQQQFIAEAIDQVFATMDFSRLAQRLVEIEVTGIYADGDIADYLYSKLQLELAKAGALSEIHYADRIPDYKANIMVRVGGVNDLVKSAPFYEWRQKQFTYDIQVAVMSLDGRDYFVQSGKGSNEVTIARRLYILFFPIPLPSEWTFRKGNNFFGQVNETYDAGKRVSEDPSLARDRSFIPSTLDSP